MICASGLQAQFMILSYHGQSRFRHPSRDCEMTIGSNFAVERMAAGGTVLLIRALVARRHRSPVRSL
jgi:hypothetical protein